MYQIDPELPLPYSLTQIPDSQKRTRRRESTPGSPQTRLQARARLRRSDKTHETQEPGPRPGSFFIGLHGPRLLLLALCRRPLL